MSEDREQADCANCSTTLDLENDLESVASNGDLLCEDCRIYCERCAQYAYEADSRYIEGEGSWCSYCSDNHTFWCECCENMYSEDIPSYHIEDSGEYWCEGCASDRATWCDTCEVYNRDECNDCTGSRLVHDYSYKPDPIFYGTDKLYFGIELEMEIRSGAISDSAEYVRDKVGEFVYLKHDSSINSGGYNGYELVSHPATLAYHTDNRRLWDTLDHLRDNYRARSWDAKSCGIHIHINRNGFKGGAHTHRFLTLIYKNAEQMMRLGGRKSTYARFNDCWGFDEYDRPYFTLKDKLNIGNNNPFSNGERYSAVNTNNRDTLELRFFRGTTKPSGVLSAIELAHASVEYTRDLTLSDVKLGALTWDWFYDWVQANNGLYPNLYTRMAKVQGLSINSQEIVNA